MADVTNFDPNNYEAFYQEALKKWEDTARAIAAQTRELAKWSAMEQVRDQWFALWQASKYWDTQSYRSKIMSDVEQAWELERSKMLAEQFGKEQAALTNQQNLLSSIGSALLQMKLAKEAARSSWWWGGWGSYPTWLTNADIAKLTGTPLSSWEDPNAPASTKKEWKFWKRLDYIGPTLMVAAPLTWPAAPFVEAWWIIASWAGIIHDLIAWQPAEAGWWVWLLWTAIWAQKLTTKPVASAIYGKWNVKWVLSLLSKFIKK